MNDNAKKANKVKFETIIKNLEKRNMKGYYCDNADEACKLGSSFIEDGSSVSFGGSVTIRDIGFIDMLKSRGLELIDALAPPSPGEAYGHYRKSLLTDYFLMSTNSITLDGKLVNIDGTGNRMAALMLGPKEVIIFAGANKVAANEADALARVKTFACTGNAARLQRTTPCAVTGKCGDCLLQECMCSHTVVTRFSRIPGRVKVILINEDLGL